MEEKVLHHCIDHGNGSHATTNLNSAEVGKDNNQQKRTEILHPVICIECKTEIGVFDEDEIYHFFEVIPS